MRDQLDNSFARQVEAQAQYSRQKRLEKEQEEEMIQAVMLATGIDREQAIKAIEETKKEKEEKQALKNRRKNSFFIYFFISSIIWMPFLLSFISKQF